MKTVLRVIKAVSLFLVINLVVGGIICYVTKNDLTTFRNILSYIGIIYVVFAGFMFSTSGTSAFKGASGLEMINSTNPNHFSELRNEKSDGLLIFIVFIIGVLTCVLSSLFHMWI